MGTAGRAFRAARARRSDRPVLRRGALGGLPLAQVPLVRRLGQAVLAAHVVPAAHLPAVLVLRRNREAPAADQALDRPLDHSPPRTTVTTTPAPWTVPRRPYGPLSRGRAAS